MRRWDGAQWVRDPWFEEGAWIEAIHGSAPNDVWVAERKRLSHWDGSTWTAVTLPEDTVAEQVWTPGGGEVWVAGEEAALYRRRGGAWERFEVEDLGGVYVWTSLSGCSPADIWATGKVLGAAGGSGFVYHWDGGGVEPRADVPGRSGAAAGEHRGELLRRAERRVGGSGVSGLSLRRERVVDDGLRRAGARGVGHADGGVGGRQRGLAVAALAVTTAAVAAARAEVEAAV